MVLCSLNLFARQRNNSTKTNSISEIELKIYPTLNYTITNYLAKKKKEKKSLNYAQTPLSEELHHNSQVKYY